MSFFGFEQNDLEKEKQKFLQGELQESEDLAVYTWGEESYDGLGDQLLEGGDELNDETFGDTGEVGKDFDFSNPGIPGELPRPLEDNRDQHVSQVMKQAEIQPTVAAATTNRLSLESIWDDRSPFSVLGRMNGKARSNVIPSPRASPAVSMAGPGSTPSGIRSLQEIENDMRTTARHASQQEALLELQRQHERDELFLRQQELEYRQRIQQQQQQEEYQRQMHHQYSREELQQLLHLQEQQQEQQEREEYHRLLRLQEQERLLQQRLQQREIEEARQLQLQYAQQEQLQRLQQQMLQREHALRQTPPPRMLPSQSPRFLDHQRQILLLQQRQEQQQQLHYQELQEQLRQEELERQLLAQQGNRQLAHIRQISGNSCGDGQFASEESFRQRSQSPSARNNRYAGPLQDSQVPRAQLQQRLLSEMAQVELMQSLSPADQETLRLEAMRKIVEAEKMEEKRRRKATKIAHMARYNDLMTQSDKDFITRIQVSQLVVQDPYADDFYAQVYGSILRSRMGLQSPEERVLKFGSGGGVGLGLAQKVGNRRPNAMQKMEQQVERIVSNARRREEEKGLHSVHSLQGALGKTSGRSYKAAPRQLLQVDSSNPLASPTLALAKAQDSKDANGDDAAAPESGAAQAAKLGREALGTHSTEPTDLVQVAPLTHRETLLAVEHVYDYVLKLEQLRRDQPTPEDEEQVQLWESEYEQLVDGMWNSTKVMVPVATSNPHPFISLLSVMKGKRMLPRVARHFSYQRMLTLLTLLIACFSQLDVVTQASLLDTLEDSPARMEVDRQTDTYLGMVMQSMIPTVVKGNLRLVTGLLGLFLDRNDIGVVSRTKPGLELLTLFLTRVELIKQEVEAGVEGIEVPTTEDAKQWRTLYDHLFELIAPHLVALFPSSRISPKIPPGQSTAIFDVLDEHVWKFLRVLSLHGSPEQHQILVATLREKVLESVLAVRKGWVADEEERRAKLGNVDLFLHALGLDSSQISL